MIPINEIMTADVITVAPTTPIYEALTLLSKHRISGLPVVNDEGDLVGILTEKDVLGLLVDAHMGVNENVDKYMTREVFTFNETVDAIEVCKFFIKHHIRRVPIVTDGKLVGVVSRADIINLILDARSQISPSYRFN